jgi:hypothetical protein
MVMPGENPACSMTLPVPTAACPIRPSLLLFSVPL